MVKDTTESNRQIGEVSRASASLVLSLQIRDVGSIINGGIHRMRGTLEGFLEVRMST